MKRNIRIREGTIRTRKIKTTGSIQGKSETRDEKGSAKMAGCGFLESVSIPFRFLCMGFMIMALLFASSCGPRTGDTPIQLYYAASDPLKRGGGVIHPLDAMLSSDEDLVSQAVTLVLEPPQRDGFYSPFPEGTVFDGYTLEEGEIVVSLSGSYSALSGLAKTLADYCLTLTLCGFDGINSVTIQSEGKSAVLRKTDVLLTDLEANLYDKAVRLYFPGGDGRYLFPEFRVIPMSEGEMLLKHIMQAILKGPEDGRLYSAIPVGTELVDIRLENGVCYLHLSAEFIENKPYDAMQERLLIYSIVNSLTQVQGVDKVQLLVVNEQGDAEWWNDYLYIPIYDAVEENSRIISDWEPDRELLDISIYTGSGAAGKMKEIPIMLENKESQPLAKTVLEAMIQGVSEAGATNLLPKALKVTAVEVEDGLCTVRLESLLPWGGRDANDVSFALQAVANTLIRLDGISMVKVAVGNSPFFYGGQDLTGPWYMANNIIL